MSSILGVREEVDGVLKVNLEVKDVEKEYKGNISQEMFKEEKYIELYKYQLLMAEKISNRDWMETKRLLTMVSLLAVSALLKDIRGYQYIFEIWLALTLLVFVISFVSVSILNRRDKNQFYEVVIEYLLEWDIGSLLITNSVRGNILKEFEHTKKLNVLKNIRKELGDCNVYRLTSSLGHPEYLSNELTFDHYTLYEKDGQYYQVAWDTTKYIKESPVFIYEIESI